MASREVLSPPPLTQLCFGVSVLPLVGFTVVVVVSWLIRLIDPVVCFSCCFVLIFVGKIMPRSMLIGLLSVWWNDSWDNVRLWWCHSHSLHSKFLSVEWVLCRTCYKLNKFHLYKTSRICAATLGLFFSYGKETTVMPTDPRVSLKTTRLKNLLWQQSAPEIRSMNIYLSTSCEADELLEHHLHAMIEGFNCWCNLYFGSQPEPRRSWRL